MMSSCPHLPSHWLLPPHTVGDWEDGDTIRGEWDEGRPATHEDSIRFGLIYLSLPPV